MKNIIQTVSIIIFLCLGQIKLTAQYFMKHTASDANGSTATTSVINDPNLNGKSNLILLVTPDYSTPAPYTQSPVGVKYNGINWTIVPEKPAATIPINAKFNVVAYELKQGDDSSFLLVHTTTANNTSGTSTTLNHRSLNFKPNARLIVTQRFGVSNPSSISVSYSGNSWRIFNSDTTVKMSLNTQFNVYINDCLIRTTAPLLNSSNEFAIDNNITNGDATATLFVTQNFGRNRTEVGVRYKNGQWYIVNQDTTKIGSQAQYFVWASRGVVQPTSCNTLKIAQLTSLLKSIDTLYAYALSDSILYGKTGCYAASAVYAFDEALNVKNRIKEFIAWNNDDVVTYAEAAQWIGYFDSMLSALSGAGHWARISAVYHGSCEGYKAAVLAAQLQSRMSDMKQQSSKCYMDAYLYPSSCRIAGLTGTVEQKLTRSNTDINLKIYPNPASQTVTINFEMPTTGDVKLDLIDIQGKIVKQFLKQKLTIGQQAFSYAISNLPEGIYFVGCSVEGTNVIERQKLVILK